MLFSGWTVFADLALLLLRFVLALVFATSGWSHVRAPKERGESIGMSPAFTAGLGVVELVGSASVLLGIFPDVGAILFIGVMLGAIHRKIFVWETGFWGDESNGWYYDLFYLVASFVVLTTGGGSWTLT